MFPQWWRMLEGAAQIWVAVSQMMPMRGPRIADSGLGSLAEGRRELTRMVTEKTAAGGESAMSVIAELWRTNWELAFVPLRWWTAWARAANGIERAVTPANLVQGAPAPLARRSAANAKRLSNPRAKRLTRRKHR